jgi:hypothetical protein
MIPGHAAETLSGAVSGLTSAAIFVLETGQVAEFAAYVNDHADDGEPPVTGDAIRDKLAVAVLYGDALATALEDHALEEVAAGGGGD